MNDKQIILNIHGTKKVTKFSNIYREELKQLLKFFHENKHKIKNEDVLSDNRYQSTVILYSSHRDYLFINFGFKITNEGCRIKLRKDKIIVDFYTTNLDSVIHKISRWKCKLAAKYRNELKEKNNE